METDGDLVCGPDCIMTWLMHDKHRVDPLTLNSNDRRVGTARLGRPETVYSSLLGRFFRSNYEKNFAEVMASWGVVFTYETVAFVWNSTKSYTPDFYFPQYKAFVELKGRWGSGQRKKYKIFRAVFPEVSMLVAPWLLEGDFRKLASKLDGRLPPLV